MTVLVIALAVYAALMTYLRATAATTETKVDDKMLEYGDKAEPVIALIKAKVDADQAKVVADKALVEVAKKA